MAQQALKFSNPQFHRLGAHIRSAAARGLPMVEKGCHKDAPGALIVGQGPSIETDDVMAEVSRYAIDEDYTVFGIKEAITWLKRHQLPVHYSVAMDPGPHQVGRTPVYPDVVYCIASSCHPTLFDHVLDGGAEVRVFHSACGYTEHEMKPGFVVELGEGDHAITLGQYEMKNVGGSLFSPVFSTVKDEVSNYAEMFPCADVVMGGFMVGNRALGLAKYMGFDHVVMAGHDFGWREGIDDHYAGFVDYKGLRDVFMSDHGRVDGKPWKTRPDMLASAVDVARHIKRGVVKVLGDSLANSLAAKDDAYLDQVVQIQS